MKYKINEIFQSLQGEGHNTGKNVVFVRLSGCDLSCDWCDTKYHVNFTEMTEKDILEKVEKIRENKSVIITGGEPTIQNLLPLLEVLKKEGYWIGIETNGNNLIKAEKEYIDYISMSPKSKTKLKNVDELRVVNDNITVDELINYENEINAKYYFISPLDDGEDINYKSTIKLLGEINEVSKKQWRLSLQMHKLSGIV
ncbi:7-carboxy-7-deazaguanine synthase QueE [Haliovirga abyssi]|uniref:7-carboxy-7-deazaguanine synthase n=1 Tax=Haliovirga abyssi TaxID=2996794 RepID=A0AAU9DDN2_9FUSO|nr:7-carboxy-7-deazaguanine synthase QueE [Haliovirga abyssi]BDU50447.1 7-carboxy-7-deazaguanine synthase [Haliovirga abyssi]